MAKECLYMREFNKNLDMRLMIELKNEEYIYSPYSLMLITYLLYSGAVDKTRDDISNIIGKKILYEMNNNGIKDIDIIKYMNYENKKIMRSKYMKITNIFLINDYYKSFIKNEYIEMLKKFGNLSFCDFNKKKEIVMYNNNYIKRFTNGLIETMINEEMLDEKVQFIMCNLIYFKAPWKKKFNFYGQKYFTRLDGKKIDCNYMHNESINYYYEDNNLKVIEIPYDDESFRFGIIIPNNNYGSSYEIYDYYYIKNLSKEKVDLTIPKFSKKSSIEIKKIYKKIGCNSMFDVDKAQFFNIFDEYNNILNILNIFNKKENFFISNILQEAVIIIDENGTEAAAKTTVYFKNFIESHESKKYFVANSTFQYYIRYIPDDLIIFKGVYDGKNE
jgi:serine protease inhibitor